MLSSLAGIIIIAPFLRARAAYSGAHVWKRLVDLSQKRSQKIYIQAWNYIPGDINLYMSIRTSLPASPLKALQVTSSRENAGQGVGYRSFSLTIHFLRKVLLFTRGLTTLRLSYIFFMACQGSSTCQRHLPIL